MTSTACENTLRAARHGWAWVVVDGHLMEIIVVLGTVIYKSHAATWQSGTHGKDGKYQTIRQLFRNKCTSQFMNHQQ